MIERFGCGSRLSNVVCLGELVFLSGQVADKPSEDVADQMQQVLGKIDALLGEVGSARTMMLSATIWLARIEDFSKINVVWDAWVPRGHCPARATVESRLAAPAYLVEISIVAARIKEQKHR